MSEVLLAFKNPLDSLSPTLMAELALFLPAVAALLVLTFTIDSRRATAVTAFLGSAGMLLAAALMAAIEVAHPGHAEASLTFIQFFTGQSGAASEFTLQWGVVADPLSALFLLCLAFVSLLVTVSAFDSLRRSEGFIRLTVITLAGAFAGAGVVLSTNYFQTLAFFLLLSASGYLLIGHWWSLPSAAAAARRAFLYLSLGDALLLVAVVYAFFRFQDLNFGHLSLAYGGGKASSKGLLIMALLLLGAALSKAGQLPLHGWLVDAVEAPAPAAALLLSGTAAVAGVYLVARTYDLFHASSSSLTALAVAGGASATLAAVWALGQDRLRPALTFACSANLGLTFLALGLGAYGPALFHLFTSTFAAAVLLLGAGAIVAALRTDRLAEMGGLMRRMPLASWTMLLAMASLSGIPPLSGFWSRGAVWSSLLSPLKGPAAAAIALASLLLAAAFVRTFSAAFLGQTARRRRFEPGRIQDVAGRVRTALVVLSLPVALSGFWVFSLKGRGFLELVRYPGIKPAPLTLGGLALTALLGILGALAGWAGGSRLRWPTPVRPALENAFYVGEAAASLTRSGATLSSRGLDWIERRVVDGALGGLEEAGALSARAPWRLRLNRLEQGALGLLAGVVLVVALAVLLIASGLRVTG